MPFDLLAIAVALILPAVLVGIGMRENKYGWPNAWTGIEVIICINAVIVTIFLVAFTWIRSGTPALLSLIPLLAIPSTVAAYCWFHANNDRSWFARKSN